MNEALAQSESESRSARRGLEAELKKAEQEVENIKQAVRLGKATAPLLEMLGEAIERARRLETELDSTMPAAKESVIKVLPSFIEKYARDLRGVLGRDVGRARGMLSRLLGEVTLRPEKDGLWAELRGDLSVILDGSGYGASSGAGRGI